MRMIIVIMAGVLLAFTAFAQPMAHYQKSPEGVLLPDPQATPGATLNVTLHHLCTKGYTKTVRNVTTAEKQHIYALYGVKPKPKVCCEVDHLISLELGGSNDLTNLWPEPYAPAPGAHEKDKLENALHQAVCAGKMTLPWVLDLYLRIIQGADSRLGSAIIVDRGDLRPLGKESRDQCPLAHRVRWSHWAFRSPVCSW